MTERPTITPADRLSLALFLAAVVHALVILGVGFTFDLPEPRREPPLIEVTLADNPSEIAPKDYDYLAQANQDGGGEIHRKERPRKAQPALMPGEPDGAAPVQASPAPTPPPEARRQSEVAATRSSPHKLARTPAEAPEQQPEPTAADLINASQQLARESASQDQLSIFAKFPTKLRIDSRTKAHAQAEYMHQWVEKIERVGNMNYPEEARRRRLSGSLILEVTLRPDGSLHEMQVLKPSQHRALDQAAMRIVRIAAPFGPIPKDVLGNNDFLVITRTWQFVNESGLSTH